MTVYSLEDHNAVSAMECRVKRIDPLFAPGCGR
jgi:hypothetical protein